MGDGGFDDAGLRVYGLFFGGMGLIFGSFLNGCEKNQPKGVFKEKNCVSLRNRITFDNKC